MLRAKLTSYKNKRDFLVTPEPKAEKYEKKEKGLNFVVQMHAATHLHYDFRLEMAGILKSWAIPKGPSLNPREKRLAIETEDHPLEYMDFEGVIPKGLYGNGTVIIWDKGTYENLSKNSSLIEDYKKGHLVIKLSGQKLRGGFSLHRMRNGEWLFIKLKDKYADSSHDIRNDNRSIVSGKPLEEIASEAIHE